MATIIATVAHSSSREVRITQAKLATRAEELRIEALKQTPEYLTGISLCNNQWRAYRDLFFESVKQTAKLGIFDVNAYANLYEHNGIPAETVGLLENEAFYLAMYDCSHNAPGNKDTRTIWKMAGADISGRVVGGALVYAGIRGTRGLWNRSKGWGKGGKITRGTMITLGSTAILFQLGDLAVTAYELSTHKSKGAEKIEETTSQMKEGQKKLVSADLERLQAARHLAEEKMHDPTLTEEKRAEWKAYADRLDGAIAFLD